MSTQTFFQVGTRRNWVRGDTDGGHSQAAGPQDTSPTIKTSEVPCGWCKLGVRHTTARHNAEAAA